MSIAYVSASSTQAGAGNSTADTTFSSGAVTAIPTGAAVCVFLWGSTGASPTTWTVTDNKTGNTYTLVDNYVNANGYENIATFYALNVQNGPTIFTGNYGSTGNTFVGIIVDCFTGVATSSALDGHNVNYQTNGSTTANSVTSGTFSPSVSGDLIWGATSNITGTAAPAIGTGFTQGQANSTYFKSEYKLSGASGSQAVTFTSGSTSDALFVTAGFALKAPQTQVYLPFRRKRTILRL